MSHCGQNACKRSLRIYFGNPCLCKTDEDFDTRASSAQTVPLGKQLGKELPAMSPQVLQSDPRGHCPLSGAPALQMKCLRSHTQGKPTGSVIPALTVRACVNGDPNTVAGQTPTCKPLNEKITNQFEEKVGNM